MSDPRELISAYLYRTITPDQGQALCAWVKADANAQLFAREVFIHRQLRDSLVGSENRRLEEASARAGDLPDPDDSQFAAELLMQVIEEDRRASQKRAAAQAQHADRANAESRERGESMSLLLGQSADVVPMRHLVIPRAVVFAAVAAMILLGVVLLWPESQPASVPPDSPAPRQASVPLDTPAPPHRFVQVATLIEQVDAQWEAASHQFGEGLPIYNESLALTRGFAKLRFENGTEVIVQAPASFEPIAADRLQLSRGRLVGRCSTPASRGFTVDTPNARIIDLGTEFGVDVNAQGYTQTHVFDGSVELAPVSDGRAAASEVLHVGEARLVGPEGTQMTAIPIERLAFVRLDEFKAQRQAREGSAYHRWLAQSYALRRDPDLIAYFPFDAASRQADQLLNGAPRTGEHLHGRLGDGQNASTRPTWAQGRFPEKASLFFDPARLQRVVVPHDPAFEHTEALTLIFWIRLNEFSDHPRTIVSKRGQDVEFQSAIYPARHAIQFATSPTAEGLAGGIHETQAISRSADWQMIAVTFRDGTAKFYRNGVRVDTAKLEYPIAHTSAEIWIGMANLQHLRSQETSEHHAFAGYMDELVILGRALDDAAVRALYESSRP